MIQFNNLILESSTSTVGNENIENFIENFEEYVGYFALCCAYVIEIIGILVIVIGVIKAVVTLLNRNIPNGNVIIKLGNSLAMGLEFKMGAEILKTVVIRTVQELLILGAIILLRAAMALLIHWEVKTEKKEISSFKNDHDKDKKKEEKATKKNKIMPVPLMTEGHTQTETITPNEKEPEV